MLGIVMSISILSCKNDDSRFEENVNLVQTRIMSKSLISSYAKDYSLLLEKYKYSSQGITDVPEYKTDLAYLKTKYSIGAYDNYNLSAKINKSLDIEIQKIIDNSEDNFSSIINNLEIYKESDGVSPNNYLVASVIIETLKLEQQNYITSKSSPKAKCAASTIGGLIGGAVAGCGAGAWGGPAGCAIGATFGAISGALSGWGMNSEC